MEGLFTEELKLRFDRLLPRHAITAIPIAIAIIAAVLFFDTCGLLSRRSEVKRSEVEWSQLKQSKAK